MLETSAREAIHAMLQVAVDPFSAPGQDHLLSIRRQISQAILERLKRARHEDDVPKAAPLVALTASYSTVLHGLALQSRDGT
jgi:hypothetical protein